jgi:predicted RNA-binding Zn-ribbon protein involved in translation (DUF1610 family)
MYNFETHSIILKKARGIPLNDTDRLILAADVTPNEESRLTDLAKDLLGSSSAAEMLTVSERSDSDFAEIHGIDEETFDRWEQQGMTDFESQMLIYLICADDYIFDRLHLCVGCGAVCVVDPNESMLCPNCRRELIHEAQECLRIATNKELFWERGHGSKP